MADSRLCLLTENLVRKIRLKNIYGLYGKHVESYMEEWPWYQPSLTSDLEAITSSEKDMIKH